MRGRERRRTDRRGRERSGRTPTEPDEPADDAPSAELRTATGGGSGIGEGDGADDDSAAGTPTPAPESDDGTAERERRRDRERVALADAHAAAPSNSSYRLSVVHREFVDGEPTGFVRERAVVANDTRYRSDLRWVGIVQQDPRATGNASTYADGTARYVRLADSTSETDLRGDRDRIAVRTAGYLRRMVAGSDTRLAGTFERDDTTRFWITVDGVDGATGSLVVDERGFVRELHYEYAYRPIDRPPIRVAVTMRVTPTNATVTAPAWVDADGGR